jgi:hypothetical protein
MNGRYTTTLSLALAEIDPDLQRLHEAVAGGVAGNRRRRQR